MYRKWRRGAAAFMAAIMVASSVQIAPPITAQAAEVIEADIAATVSGNKSTGYALGWSTEKTFTADQLTESDGSGKAELVDGKIKITFGAGAEWCQVRLKLPEEINVEDCESVKVKVANQTEAMGIKLYAKGSEWYSEAQVQYGNAGQEEYTVVVDPTIEKWTGDPKIMDGVGFMCGQQKPEEDVTFEVVSITCVMKDEAGPTDPTELKATTKNATLTYSLMDLEEKGESNATTPYEKSGNMKIAFAGQYAAVNFAIPEEIDTAKLKKISVKLKWGSAGSLAIKTFSNYRIEHMGEDGKYETEVKYGNIEIAPTQELDDLGYFGLMSLSEEPIEIKVESVSFTVEGAVTYPAAMLEKIPSAAVTVAPKDKGAEELTFAAQNAEQVYIIPAAEKMDKVENVRFNLSTGDAAKFRFKTYKKEDYDSETEDATEYVDGEAVISPTTDTESLVYLAICNNDAEQQAMLLDSITFEYATDTVSETLHTDVVDDDDKEENPDITYGDNIIANGNFAEEDLTVWTMSQGKSKITAETAETAIFDEVKTYGKIDRSEESGTGDGFYQDITAKVQAKEEYQVEFWAMLSDDYKDAPEDQRILEFAPYIDYKPAGAEEDAEPTRAYLGASYSSQLSRELRKALEPGKWTKYEGTFKIQADGDISKVVIRIIEQGTNWGSGDCVKGDFYITGVSMKKIDKPIPEIEKDIPDWKNSITEKLGASTIAGTAITAGDLSDDTMMELVRKHFNAITFGNELKPDATFNYSNDKCPGTQTITFNGKELVVPVTNFSRSDAMANAVLKWNEENPETPIKIRGHVLVWHSQTPEWFFHEDYDADKPDVSKEVMDQRMEWYIWNMYNHFFGPEANGKYDNLFYGWDVVNEAVSDGRPDYRNAEENSSWYRVYGSEEFIAHAFVYANKYAPKNVELYYNDYGDTSPTKSEGIAKLLTMVKNTEGARIDGMGMQAHYNVDSFNVDQFREAALKYGKIVGKIQLTELDFTSSSTYANSNGNAEAKAKEYTKNAYRHKAIFETLQEIQKEDNGITVSGITVWGVTEPTSWLHQHASVGGGADGVSKQCPLLFDGNYKAKPSYWAYVDPSKLDELDPSIQNIAITAGDIENGNTYEIKGATAASFVPVWDKDGIKVQVTVLDATADDTDSVTVYVDEANSEKDGITPKKATVARKDGKAVDGGYQVTVSVPLENLKVAQKIGFDVVVVNGTEKTSFNDTKNTQETSSKFYAKAIMKPGVAVVPEGTVTIDGEKDAAWDNAVKIPLTISQGAKATAEVSVLWDKDNLYVFAEVTDDVLNKANSAEYQQDSLEVFIDENNHKSSSYEADDKQYRINYDNELSFNGSNCKAENMDSKTKTTDTGYVVEAAFKWTEITPADGMLIGADFQINDADASGKRIGTVNWFDETGMGWSAPEVYGVLKLAATEKEHTHTAVKEWSKDANYHWHECEAQDGAKLNKAKHTWDAGKVTKEPTCRKKGVKTYTCTVCKATKTEKIKATGKHDYKEIVKKKASFGTTGNYIKKCKVCGKEIKKNISRIGKITLATKQYTYQNKNLKPAVTVKNQKGKALKQGTDYTVSYKDNKNPGKATVTVKFKGRYTGTKKLTFKIMPKATKLTATAKSKAIAIKITKDAKVSGYKVEYSTDKKFTSSTTKTVDMKAKTAKTISKLKSGTTYYVRARSYKTVGNKKYYSSYSKVITVKVK